jgi:hypothetical protein
MGMVDWFCFKPQNRKIINRKSQKSKRDFVNFKFKNVQVTLVTFIFYGFAVLHFTV